MDIHRYFDKSLPRRHTQYAIVQALSHRSDLRRKSTPRSALIHRQIYGFAACVNYDSLQLEVLHWQYWCPYCQCFCTAGQVLTNVTNLLRTVCCPSFLHGITY